MSESAADLAGLQGLWRVVEIVSELSPVYSSTTHWQFSGGRVKQITPSLVDGGQWAALALDPITTPKRLTSTYEFTDRRGAVTARAYRHLYELSGDTLRVCTSTVLGEWPAAISDRDYMVTTCVRDLGPPPAVKLASNTPPVDDAVLGRVAFDDNSGEWEAWTELRPGHEIGLTCDAEDRSGAAGRMRTVVRWLVAGDRAARRYAAAELLDLYNDVWAGNSDDADTESGPGTPAGFARRLTLDDVHIADSGSLSLWYDDGDLFRGHVVVVQVDADGNFTDAGIS